jgi:hypothetical protein
MRIQVIVPALALMALTLGGCALSPSAEGVLPRTDVPPPPSVNGRSRQPVTTGATGATAQQRRGLSVPPRLVPPRPAAAR